MQNHAEYLNKIIINTLNSDDLEQAIRNITMELGKLFNADRVHFRLYDPKIEKFSEVVEEYRKTAVIPSSKGKMIYPHDFDEFLKQKLLSEKGLFIIDDINAPEFPEEFRKLFKNLSINNEIVLPIFYRDELDSAFFITNTESKQLLSHQNLEFLMPVAKNISIGTHLFKINSNLIKRALYEKILREIIMEVRLYERPDEVFEYLVDRLSDIYLINRAGHLRPEESNNFIVIFEAIKPYLKKLKGEILIKAEYFEELSRFAEGQIIVINNTEDIKKTELKEQLQKNKISALLIYPLEETYPMEKKTKLKDRIIVCSEEPKKWSQLDIDTLILIVGTISLIYGDILKKETLKEIEQTLIASLVHDLKSPIYAEQKALETILLMNPETDISEIKEYLKIMYNTNDEMLKMIQNMLMIYSLEFGSQKIEKTPSDITEIINNSINILKPLIEEHESKIKLDIQENIEEIKMDPVEVKRVVINLLTNAIKHNPKGVEIIVSAHKEENVIQVSVKDNGFGIPETERDTIFEKYRPGKGKVGTGLGLHLSKQIIDYHNGKIWFESEEGKGSTFYFTLPIE